MKKRLFDVNEMGAAIDRITDEILAAFSPDEDDPVLVGIHHLGVPLAQRIRDSYEQGCSTILLAEY